MSNDLVDVNALFTYYASLDKARRTDHPCALLAVRVGDYYEFYDQDAETVAKLAEITLTTRFDGKTDRHMCGYPVHSIEKLVTTLRELSIRVALCNLSEAPPVQHSQPTDRDIAMAYAICEQWHRPRGEKRPSQILADYRAECEEVAVAPWREALQDLVDQQNGPPTRTREVFWNEAMEEAYRLLKNVEPSAPTGGQS